MLLAAVAPLHPGRTLASAPEMMVQDHRPVMMLLVPSRQKFRQDVAVQPSPVPNRKRVDQVGFGSQQLGREPGASQRSVQQGISSPTGRPGIGIQAPRLRAFAERRDHFLVDLDVMLDDQEPLTSPRLLEEAVVGVVLQT